MVKLLDHGYVKLVEPWGHGLEGRDYYEDDADFEVGIIEAARMSTGKGFQRWEDKVCHGCKESPVAGTIFRKMFLDDGMGTEVQCETCKGSGTIKGDQHLLSYLWRNHHATPFEMAGMVIEVQAPIFVFREWHRHRTQSYNELSARYTELPDLSYIPNEHRIACCKQSNTNKQGSDTINVFGPKDIAEIHGLLTNAQKHARFIYEELLNKGVSREIARLVIPVNQYSRMRAAANLRNWLSFTTLRTPENVQWETRQYGLTVSNIIREVFPRTWELWNEGQA